MDSPGLRIELARPPDAPAVVALLADQLREHGISTPLPSIAAAVDGLLADPSKGFVLVARSATGPLLGVAYVAFTWTVEHGGRSGWLEELYVVPGARRAGLGGRLLDAVLLRCEEAGCTAVDLEVDRTHDAVERLYQGRDFTRLDRTRWVRGLRRFPRS